MDVVSLGKNGAIDGSGAVTVTLNRAPAAGSLLIASCVRINSDGTTPSGPSSIASDDVTTWYTIADNAYDPGGTIRAGHFVRGAYAEGTPTDTSVIVTPGGTYAVFAVEIIEVSGELAGVDLSSDLASLFLQIEPATNVGAVEAVASMATLAASENLFLALGGWTAGSSQDATPRTDFTELTDDGSYGPEALVSFYAGLYSEYAIGLPDADPSVNYDIAGGFEQNGIIVLEIAAATAGQTGSVSDGAVASDSAAANVEASAGISEGAIASDDVVGSAGKAAVLEDVAVASEHMATVVTVQGSPEVAIASDDPVAQRDALQAASDSAVASDGVAGVSGKAGAIADIAVVSDEASPASARLAGLQDVAVAFDNVSRGGAQLGTSEDVAIASDLVGMRAAVQQLLEDVAAASDDPVAAKRAGASVSEIAVASDGPSPVLAAVVALSDVAVASDLAAMLGFQGPEVDNIIRIPHRHWHTRF